MRQDRRNRTKTMCVVCTKGSGRRGMYGHRQKDGQVARAKRDPCGVCKGRKKVV